MMQNADPCAHLGRMIAASRRLRQFCLVALSMDWFYLDETVVNIADGPHGRRHPTEMFVGGCIAPQREWDQFTGRWNEALALAGVTSFHATDFYAFQGQFKWIKDGERDWQRHGEFRDKLADIILDHADELLTFTSMAPIKDKGVRKAYEDAVFRVFWDCSKFKIRDKETLYIVLARHPELSPWSILRKFEQIDWEKKLAGCAIFNPDDVPPLQAADFVLNSLNKAWKGDETASLKRLQEGCRKRNKPFHQQIVSTADMEKLVGALPSLGR